MASTPSSILNYIVVTLNVIWPLSATHERAKSAWNYTRKNFSSGLSLTIQTKISMIYFNKNEKRLLIKFVGLQS